MKTEFAATDPVVTIVDDHFSTLPIAKGYRDDIIRVVQPYQGTQLRLLRTLWDAAKGGDLERAIAHFDVPTKDFVHPHEQSESLIEWYSRGALQQGLVL